jgi:chaperonin GroES
MSIKADDKVMYFKYAGDKMYDTEGKEYVVLHENDILATF